MDTDQRIAAMSFASVYPHYLAKVQKKGRTEQELQQVISWLTGYSTAELQQHLAHHTRFTDFFSQAQLPAGASLVTGTICGVRIEHIKQPLTRQVRILDKLVDELAKGRPLEKILRH